MIIAKETEEEEEKQKRLLAAKFINAPFNRIM